VQTDSASQELPRRKTGRFLSWVEQRSLIAMILIAMALYLEVAVLVSLIEVAAQCERGCAAWDRIRSEPVPA
jgi:hypothetical protein